MKLRAAQEEILKYRQGRLAINAVPGSGKTFTLAALAAELIADSRVNVEQGQQILIVTYLNSSVENFRERIRQMLAGMELMQSGYEVRTLHSLAHEIIQISEGTGVASDSETTVTDNIQSDGYISQATSVWFDNHPDIWNIFAENQTIQQRARRRDSIEYMAARFIRTAKNEQYSLEKLNVALAQKSATTYQTSLDRPSLEKLDQDAGDFGKLDLQLLHMLTGIYANYQQILTRTSAIDFDDLIWKAFSVLTVQPDLVLALRTRWPYILEDEAQDSVPLQTLLLAILSGEQGNWVRVGDPNQAITSTFTASHPRQFVSFLRLPDVNRLPLPNSGRCAPLIMNAANHLVRWVSMDHPVPEVRESTFLFQEILPTPPGDPQQNPSDNEAELVVKVYESRENNELPAIARNANQLAINNPDSTLAILVPTNEVGRMVASQLDLLGAPYDDLLRGGQHTRDIAAALYSSLALLVEPLSGKRLVDAWLALNNLGHPAGGNASANNSKIEALLRSVVQVEWFLFPEPSADPMEALPEGVANEVDKENLSVFIQYVMDLFDLKTLPVEDLVLALSDDIFLSLPVAEIHEADLGIAYQIAHIMKNWRDLQPDWRLPELASQLREVAEGYRQLPVSQPRELGFEPIPGRITLSTQHGAKGMEWDTVFLVGADGNWFPNDLDGWFQGVDSEFSADLSAELIAQLRYLMDGTAGIFTGRTATDSAHIEVISERLRLLYVAVTRARRRLYISRSRRKQVGRGERHAPPSTAVGVLYEYINEQEIDHQAS